MRTKRAGGIPNIELEVECWKEGEDDDEDEAKAGGHKSRKVRLVFCVSYLILLHCGLQM